MNCIRKAWTKATKMTIAVDCFSSPILLRYQSDDKKSTKTGGFFSLILIILLLSLLASSWIDVLDKKQINSEASILRDLDPEKKQITKDDFFFILGISGMNIINQTQRYFDLIVTQEVRINATISQSYPIEMIQCQRAEFQKIGEQYANTYDHLSLNQSLCLPSDFKITLAGKYASPFFSYLRIHIKRCSGEGCKSDEQFQQFLKSFGAFYINYYFINRLLNPTKLNPVSIYFEDKNYNMINNQIAIDTNLYLAQYIMETDESIWPWQQNNTTTGVYADRNQKQEFVHPAQNGTYAQFHIRKSDQKMIIKRSFRGVDDLLSYIGGLFGILSSIFGIIITHYNQCCFEMQMSHKVFKADKDQEQEKSLSSENQAKNKNSKKKNKELIHKDLKDSFNFIVYIKYLLSIPILILFPKFQWREIKRLSEQLEQTRNQLNIDTLLQKISFYQRSLQCLFDTDEMILLYFQQKISIAQLKKQRMIMNMKDDFSEQQTPSNQIANEYIIKDNKQMKNNSLAAIFAGISFDKQVNIRSTLARNAIQHEIVTSKYNDHDIELSEQISEALMRIKQKANEGNVICERILSGVRAQLLEKYKKWQTQQCLLQSVKDNNKQGGNNLQIRPKKPKISGFLNLNFDPNKMLQTKFQPTNSQLFDNNYQINVLSHIKGNRPKNVQIFDVQSYKKF